MANTETIIIQPLTTLVPGSTFLNEEICVDLSLNYTGVGGSFSISLLKDSVNPLPLKNTVLSLPFGRVGIVKNVGGGLSSGGLVDTISGPAVPLSATQINFFGVEPGTAQFLSFLASFFGGAWGTLDIPIKNFSFRGFSLSALQQLATYMLADVIVRKDGIVIVDPGAIVGITPFFVSKSDVVSASQVIDSSLDVVSILNPALTTVQLNDEGNFVFDSQHAQKQPKTTVQAGTANAGFIPIPDGWHVDGNFEEWAPVAGSGTVDNPSPSVGRYWKQFPSPNIPGLMRGITNFTRLVKDMQLPGNVSTFVGSPVTAATGGNSGLPNVFNFLGASTQSGIFGFLADDTVISDVVTGQYLELKTALELTPVGGASGDASLNFFSLDLEFWTFPRVNPQVFGVGDPVNPFNIPKNVVVVNPNSNVANLTPQAIQAYWNKYLANYQLINSPRLKTSITTVYRNRLPQVGDNLIVEVGVLKFSVDCGRIQSVSLRMSRTGMVLNITAEKFKFT